MLIDMAAGKGGPTLSQEAFIFFLSFTSLDRGLVVERADIAHRKSAGGVANDGQICQVK